MSFLICISLYKAIKMSEFRNEWYHHPYIEGFFLLIVKFMRFITLPYVAPIWLFILTFIIGGMSIWYTLGLCAFAAYIGWRVWIHEENLAKEFVPEPEDEEPVGIQNTENLE